MVGEVQHRPADGVIGGPLLLPVGGGVDAQKVGVRVVGHIGVDRVAQPTLLSHLLEQAGGTAAPEDGVHQLDLVPPGVQIVGGGEGQQQVVLLDGLFPGRHRRAVGGGPGGGSRPGLQGVQAGAQAVHLILGEAARQRHHDVPRAVVLLLPGAQPLPGHGGQGGGPAQDGPGQGGALINHSGQPLAHQILRGVLVHADLLQHHAPLHLHVLLVEAGGEQHVQKQVGRPIQMLVQTAGVEAGVLLGGIGVHLAADGVHLPGQVSGGAAAGALEHHVLDEVGRAVLCRLLVAGAHAHKEPQGGGTYAGDRQGQDRRPIGQDRGLIHGDLQNF